MTLNNRIPVGFEPSTSQLLFPPLLLSNISDEFNYAMWYTAIFGKCLALKKGQGTQSEAPNAI